MIHCSDITAKRRPTVASAFKALKIDYNENKQTEEQDHGHIEAGHASRITARNPAWDAGG
jgi:hypothetical protein